MLICSGWAPINWKVGWSIQLWSFGLVQPCLQVQVVVGNGVTNEGTAGMLVGWHSLVTVELGTGGDRKARHGRCIVAAIRIGGVYMMGSTVLGLITSSWAAAIFPEFVELAWKNKIRLTVTTPYLESSQFLGARCPPWQWWWTCWLWVGVQGGVGGVLQLILPLWDILSQHQPWFLVTDSLGAGPYGDLHHGLCLDALHHGTCAQYYRGRPGICRTF